MSAPVLTAEEFKIWKKRRRATNSDLAMLTGRSPSTVDRKLHGRTPITPGLTLALANIDRLIAAGLEPENCPPRQARLILARKLR
jgi:transcriptional regulator with XRE-family HTH domain